MTPENVVSERGNAFASRRKQLTTPRDKISPLSPTHGRGSRRYSRVIMTCFKALMQPDRTEPPFEPRWPIYAKAPEGHSVSSFLLSELDLP